MKSVNTFAIGLFLSLGVSAGAATPLAGYHLSVPFGPQTGYETVNINDDGSVVFESHFRDHSGVRKDLTETIAQLESAKVAALSRQIAMIREGDLIDPKAGMPGCFDAPGRSYFVIQAGVPVDVESHEQCHTAKNETEAGRTITELIKGLVALAELK